MDLRGHRLAVLPSQGATSGGATVGVSDGKGESLVPDSFQGLWRDPLSIQTSIHTARGRVTPR